MKKLLSLILSVSMLLCLVACSGEQEKQPAVSIVGEWMAPSYNAAAVFNEDGTGELSLHGEYSVTWSVDTRTGKYVVYADETYYVTAGKEYEMPYLNIDGIDFYKMDDYDNAYNLLISRRCEDIVNLTSNMTKVNVGENYDLENGMSIQFTGISVSNTAENDGLQLDYLVVNHRAEAVTEPVSLKLKAKCYLAEEAQAVEMEETFDLFDSLDADSGHNGAFRFSLLAKVEETVNKYGMVIGAVYFEMYGKTYYIDLAVLK